MKFFRLYKILTAVLLVSLFSVLVPASPARAIGVVTLDVNQGSIGQQITISGSGFYGTLPSETSSRGVHIIFGNSNPGATIDYAINIHEIVKIQELTDGSFSTTFLVPENLTGATLNEAVSNGTYYVYLTYYYPAPPTIKGLNILDISSFIVTTPEITIDLDDGTVGTEVEINGTGFGNGEDITVKYDGNTLPTSGDDDANSSGAFGDTTIAIPPSTAGKHTITVTDEVPSASAEAEFTVKPKITVSPASGTAGTTVEVSGTGFAGEENITIDFNSQEATTSTTDDKGSFTAIFVPTIIAIGDYNIDAEDGTNSASSGFEITAVSLTISPATGVAGTQVNVIGDGYLPNQFILIYFNDIDMTPFTKIKSNSNGAFAVTFNVPIPTAGTYKIEATDGTNTREVDFTIPSPAATGSISPVTSLASPGYVGSQLTLKGDRFTPNGAVTITYDSDTITTATVKSDGSFSASIEVPSSSAGEHIISATDGTNSKEYIFVMESAPPAAPPQSTPETGVKAKAEAFFDWQDVTDESGVVYSFQISTDANFPEASLVINETGLEISEYAIPPENKLQSVSEEAPYYWRVRAYDGAGNESPWTGARSFYVGSSFSISQGFIYVIITVVALALAIFTFWMGRKTAYY